jgi:hypothetical protein
MVVLGVDENGWPLRAESGAGGADLESESERFFHGLTAALSSTHTRLMDDTTKFTICDAWTQKTYF